MVPAGPCETPLSDPFRLFGIAQKIPDLFDKVFKIRIGHDFFPDFINQLQLRMILGEIEPAAHGNLEVSPIETVSVREPDDAAEAEVDPAF